MRSFDDPELDKEYKLELVKSAARVDFALDDEKSRFRDRELLRKQFIYSFFGGLVGACIGFWIGYFTR